MSLISMAEFAKSPDSRNSKNSPQTWNIIGLVCYRYKKQHCESFFRDPRLYRLFLAVFSNQDYLKSLRTDIKFINELQYLMEQAIFIHENASPEVQTTSKRFKKA